MMTMTMTVMRAEVEHWRFDTDTQVAVLNVLVHEALSSYILSQWVWGGGRGKIFSFVSDCNNL